MEVMDALRDREVLITGGLALMVFVLAVASAVRGSLDRGRRLKEHGWRRERHERESRR